ncbi:hypothetical protein F4780DRAFT_194692 [Xylariomycetidae sp. FL0641]|nr:hypothetical protein F4780DRAFT_194692 [Xylariomycetidae sp. FL0641]
MSSPATAPKEGKEKRGMGKVLYRVKTVFRKGEGSRKTPAAAAAPSGPPLMSSSAPATAAIVPAQAKKAPHYEGATKIPRIQVHEERAKKLGARFGLEIKPDEWHSSEGDVLRIDKPVRMRIHRECHRCHAQFGASNQCPKCQHTRCKQCTRYPTRRNEAERQANRERREALMQKNKDLAPILPSYDYAEQITLKRPGKPGGQELVFKGRPRMRVRRICHICSNQISSHGNKSRTCDNCGHRRCGDCPRNPDARDKYPFGYPNDEPGEKFKGVYSCHECRAKFPPNVENGTECPKCSHKKCDQCPRVKPRKVEPEPDPAILEDLRVRMAGLTTTEG